MRTRLYETTPRIADWVESKVGPSDKTSVERLGDLAEDVADFEVTRATGEKLRVSLKYNHAALKHPRPYSLAAACGLDSGSAEDLSHRAKMKRATEPLTQVATLGKKSLYRDLPNETHQMYHTVVEVCADSLNGWLQAGGTRMAERLFSFLVGVNFFKVIVSDRVGDPVDVQDYSQIPLPRTAIATTRNSYLCLKFDNGWQVELRLHTASSRLPRNLRSQLSLKFDAQRIAGLVSSSQLDIS